MANTPGSTTATTAASGGQPANGSSAPAGAPAKVVCPNCQAPIAAGQTYCGDCGCVFSPDGPSAHSASVAPTMPSKVKDRYEFDKLTTERGNVQRFRGRDLASGTPVPVVILRAPKTSTEEVPAAEVVAAESVEPEPVDVEVLPAFEEPLAVVSVEGDANAAQWPSLGWERALIEKAACPSLPSIVDHFEEGDWEYLVEEIPSGTSLWDAWDDPETNSNAKRYPLLVQVAQALHTLTKAGAMLESIRPDNVVITPDGKARLNDLSELLPLPLPPNPPLRASLYTAPELVVGSETAGPRSCLYSFGAMLFSLFVGRELTEKEFEREGHPKSFIAQYPDIHPLFGRLISKTFMRDINFRFPTDEAGKTDPTGLTELAKTLEVAGQVMDDIRMEIAAWTTIGIIRTGNEDAFALLHAAESRLDECPESALILLCDGMGGYEAGEIAAALCIQTLRKVILENKMFAALTGDTPTNQTPFDLEACKKALYDALKEANRVVNTAPSQGIGRRGMGCTAEAVYINGRNLVVGHVGDSRTYHLNQGSINQVTRDQTLVNRLVELGQLSAAEAENHPRKNELQQAIGGRATVEPAVYSATIKSGDWVLVCSDGLTNHIQNDELRQMMLYEANSAEIAARRLVNFANIRGATDNSTVVVVRLT